MRLPTCRARWAAQPSRSPTSCRRPSVPSPRRQQDLAPQQAVPPHLRPARRRRRSRPRPARTWSGGETATRCLARYVPLDRTPIVRCPPPATSQARFQHFIGHQIAVGLLVRFMPSPALLGTDVVDCVMVFGTVTLRVCSSLCGDLSGWLQVADPTHTETQWAHRQRELLNRRLYLKNFWYAAGECTAFHRSAEGSSCCLHYCPGPVVGRGRHPLIVPRVSRM